MNIKTQTKISANIIENGLSLYIFSPEIGEAMKSGSFLNYFWENKEEIEKVISFPFDFSKMVKFFATPPKYRNFQETFVTNSDFYYELFNFLLKKYPQKFSQYPHKISFDPNYRSLIDRGNTINLAPFSNPNILKGEKFIFKGVYSTKIIKENILPTYKAYAESFISTFLI